MPTADEIKGTMKSQYAAVAPAWDKWFEWNRRNLSAPLTEWCCDALALAPGMQVLDLACGAGAPCLEEAARVRPGGKVLATDLSPEMYALAERRARDAGLGELTFRAMDAESIDLPDASVDAVSMLFALMFCPRPEQAMAEIHRVLRPGGRFALTVWDVPDRNSYFTTIGKPTSEFLHSPPPDPKAPHQYRFAPPGELEAVLCAGGFTEFSVASRTLTVRCDSFDQYFEMTTETAAGLRAKLATMPDADRARLKDKVAESARPLLVHGPGGPLDLTMTPLCASGKKPG